MNTVVRSMYSFLWLLSKNYNPSIRHLLFLENEHNIEPSDIFKNDQKVTLSLKKICHEQIIEKIQNCQGIELTLCHVAFTIQRT